MSEVHPAAAQRIHGSFRSGEGISVRLGAGVSEADRAAAQMHEWIHYELSDNTTYGWLQAMLLAASRWTDLPPAVRHRAGEAFHLATDACAQVHEGLATYRALTWYVAYEGRRAAERHRAEVPERYRGAYQLVAGLLGDPIEVERGPALATAVHLTCLYLGYVALNVPLLAHYPGPAALLRPALPHVTHDSPDERFRAFVAQPGTRRIVHDQFRRIKRALKAEPENAPDSELTFSLADDAIAALRHLTPPPQPLTFTEGAAEVHALSASWCRALEAEFGLEVAQGRSGIRPPTVVLEPRFVRDRSRSSVSTVAGPAAAMRVDAQEHAALVRGATPDWLTFSFLATLPIEAALDGRDPEAIRAGVATYWLGTAGPDTATPRVREVCLLFEDSLAGVVGHSARLSGAAHLWYTNPNIVRVLRHRGTPIRGYTIEHRESSALVLDAADEAESPPVGWADVGLGRYEGVVMVLHRTGATFSLRWAHQTELFASIAGARWPRLAADDVVPIGDRQVTVARLARLAMWGNLQR